MTVARTAAHYGARSPTGSRSIGFLREGERVTGVVAADAQTGERVQGARASR